MCVRVCFYTYSYLCIYSINVHLDSLDSSPVVPECGLYERLMCYKVSPRKEISSFCITYILKTAKLFNLPNRQSDFKSSTPLPVHPWRTSTKFPHRFQQLEGTQSDTSFFLSSHECVWASVTNVLAELMDIDIWWVTEEKIFERWNLESTVMKFHKQSAGMLASGPDRNVVIVALRALECHYSLIIKRQNVEGFFPGYGGVSVTSDGFAC